MKGEVMSKFSHLASADDFKSASYSNEGEQATRLPSQLRLKRILVEPPI